ncbi:MAG: ComEC/Rec2 family competence protein [Candidatus Andersenbacteria bacterium]|nr:ComEC/Rec2 family competence protein [Candidatus Andersenbacteria bacterium]
MRASVCILVVSWVVGITAGVFQAVPMLLGACGLSMLAIAYYMRLRTQFFIAVIALIYLGFIYGGGIVQPRATVCQGETTSYATLDHAYSISFDQAVYVFKRNDGCSILVYMNRFPLLARGTQAHIQGSQVISSIFLQDDGIDLIVKHANVEVLHKGTSIIDTLRIRGIETLSRYLSEPDASISIGMLLGDRGTISQNIQDEFRVSGISHVLSISGLHVSILVGVLALVLQLLPIPPIFRFGIMAIVMWVYIASIGAPLSAVRAGVFWTLYALAYRARVLIGASTVPLAVLALLMTFDPRAILSPGFQLSMAAVTGIFLMLRLVSFRLHPVSSLFFVSLGATIGTFPLVVYYFGGIPTLGILVNILIVPITPALLIAILLVLAGSVISPIISLMFSYVVHILILWTIGITSSVQYIPYAYIDHLSMPGWGVFAFYALLLCGVVLFMHQRRMHLRELWI